ncbi:MAG: hypothetical protein JWM85_189 [Acidimicrobiaceae bacterium]|nr:hypothetical protein [Acidimicrobiaceae bacterium]
MRHRYPPVLDERAPGVTLEEVVTVTEPPLLADAKTLVSIDAPQ